MKNLKVCEAVKGLGIPTLTLPFLWQEGGGSCLLSRTVSDCLLWSLPTGIPASAAHSHTHGQLPPKCPWGDALSHNLTPAWHPPSNPAPSDASFFVSTQEDSILIEDSNLGDFRMKLEEYLATIRGYLRHDWSDLAAAETIWSPRTYGFSNIWSLKPSSLSEASDHQWQQTVLNFFDVSHMVQAWKN